MSNCFMGCVFCSRPETDWGVFDDNTGQKVGAVCQKHRKEFKTPTNECSVPGCQEKSDYTMQYVNDSDEIIRYATVCDGHFP